MWKSSEGKVAIAPAERPDVCYRCSKVLRVAAMKPVEIPLRAAIKARTHPPRYMMHKFWARKPHNVIATYVQHFSEAGDIVMDPFCGSGVTICEALHAGRRAVGLDLNPIAIFISRMTCLPLEIAEFDEAAAQINKALAEFTESAYETRCPKCRRATEASHFVWVNEATCERCATVSLTNESNRRGGFFYCLSCGHRLKM
jgi:adenine-specific DNA methylase